MRYRYIFAGGVEANDNISNFRLLDKQKMQGFNSAIRVEIMDDAILEKWKCDEYSTWDSKNKTDYQLKDLNPKICVKINGKWNVLEDATEEWLNGETMNVAIQNNIEGKYYRVPVYNIGYLTIEQYRWYRDKNNMKYAWRLDNFPSNLKDIKIPELTPAQLETIDFVRQQFNEYYVEVINNSYIFEEDEKQEAKLFFKELIDNISDDDLAYEWHRYSTTGLDPNKKFETKEMIEKIKKSSYRCVSKDHYKYAIDTLIENMVLKFDLEKCRKEKMKDNYER